MSKRTMGLLSQARSLYVPILQLYNLQFFCNFTAKVIRSSYRFPTMALMGDINTR